MLKIIEKYFTPEQWEAFCKFNAGKFEIEQKQAELEAIRTQKQLAVEKFNADEQAKLQEIAALKAVEKEEPADGDAVIKN
jgi:hypothetical protein